MTKESEPNPKESKPIDHSRPPQDTSLVNISLPSRNKMYLILLGLFISILLLTNCITAKYFTIFGISMTAGVITYPITFLLSDIITEVYGKKKATITVWMGFMASLFMMLVITIIGKMKSGPDSTVNDETYQLMFGYTPGIILGSMTAYLISQLTDVYIYQSIKKLTKGKHLWIRNNAATIISELIDTIVFAITAWLIWPIIDPSDSTPIISLQVWCNIALAEYIFKVIFAICDTPILYGSLYLIDKFTIKEES